MTPTERQIAELFVQFPICRSNHNFLVMAYWIRVNGWPKTMSDFHRTTPVETILREARRVFEQRPDLSGEGVYVHPLAGQQFFEDILKVFPNAVVS